MRFELKTAWRELHSSWRRFVFATVAVGVGVGALTGVKGFAEALHSALLKQSRELIAADFAVRLNTLPTPAEQDALDELQRRGTERTMVTETLSMSAGEHSDRPILVSVKAVEPTQYPFYGKLILDPSQPLPEALTAESAVVSGDYLQRLGLSVGDRIQLGDARFRIAAVLQQEPDRLASGMEIGPRLMISQQGMARTNLLGPASRVSRAYLYRIRGPNYDLDAARSFLEALPSSRLRMTDYRRPNPQLDRGLDRMSTFLSLVSLISLLVGGLGVAMSMHAYLQQKLDSVAIMKMLGGRSMQILRIYLYQGLFVGLAGSALGVALGYGVQILFPRVIAGLLDLPVELNLAPSAAIQGFSVGGLATALLILPPLLAIRHVRPAQVLRRNMAEDVLFRPTRWRAGMGWAVLSALALLLALGGIATWLGGSWRRGFGFLAALAAALIVLLAIARGLARTIPHLPQARSVIWRHGLSNLNRPGSQSTPVFVALGIGVMLTAAVYLMQSSLLEQIVRSAPADFPNLVLFGIPEKDKDPLWSFLRSEPNVIDSGIPVPALPGRLRVINGVPIEEYQARRDSGALPSGAGRDGQRDGGPRRFGRGEFQLTWAEKLPPDARILEGKWWDEKSSPDESGSTGGPQVSVAEFLSRNFEIHPGDELEFSAFGKLFKAWVASVREVLFVRPGSNNAFIFSPGVLDGLPASYVANLKIRPEAIGIVQRQLFNKFPTITSVHVGEILATVQKLLDRISLVIQFVAAFAILAGGIILASAVAATRQRRVKESVLLKTLGATRALVARIQAVEFLVLGFAAGAVGSLAANALAYYLLGYLLDAPYDFRWESVAVCSVATALLAMATGRIAGRGILNHKPLEVLREE